VLLTEFLLSSLRRNPDSFSKNRMARFRTIGWSLLTHLSNRQFGCWIGYQPSSETTVRASNTYQQKQRGAR
jgi:hypothetical protein